MAAIWKKIRKSDYFHTLIAAILVIAIVCGFWFGSQAVLNTKILPILAVESGSMCIPYGSDCEGWTSLTHPFARTLHRGDLIIIQNVDPHDLNANYPDSDIIVYQNPLNPTDPNAKIVHRIVAKEEIDGILYFYTKGDGNPVTKWPETPQPREYDSWSPVAEDQIYGKVIMRIPWVGYIPLLIQETLGANNTLAVVGTIIALIAILIILEVTWPKLKQVRLRIKRKKSSSE